MPRVTAAEKVRRDPQIIADRARGLTWSVIAERHGISERACRTIFTECRRHANEDHEVPEHVVTDALLSVEQVIEDLALLAESTRNDAVRLGAIKSRLDAITFRITMMQAVGILPDDLAWVAYQKDGRETADAIMTVLHRHDVPNTMLEEMLSALGGPPAAPPNGSSLSPMIQ